MAKPATPKRPVPKIDGPHDDAARLPPRVAALREKILEACAARDVEALKVPIQWAETPPIFLRGPGRPRTFAEIVDFLRARSFDRNGVEMTTILRAVFESPFARKVEGPFETYVWPAQALLWPDKPDANARAKLFSYTRFADLGSSDEAGRPLIHSAGVGADGTWHWFTTQAAAQDKPQQKPQEKSQEKSQEKPPLRR